VQRLVKALATDAAIAKRVAKKVVKALAPKLNVASAVNATNATNATNAAKATTATSAASATHATSAGALDSVVYRSKAGTALFGEVGTATAVCDDGEHVLGGGVKVDDPTVAAVGDEYPSVGNTGWTAHVDNFGPDDVAFTVYAICTTVNNPG
jgi:hypothetical protein